MDLASITEARLSDSTTCDVGILGAVGRFLDVSESGGRMPRRRLQPKLWGRDAEGRRGFAY